MNMFSTRNFDEVVEINNRFYALNGWNGEAYTTCFEVDSEGLVVIDFKTNYIITPIYNEVDEDIIDIIDFTVEKGVA